MTWTGLVLPSYVLASILFTWPVIGRFTSAIPSSRAALDPTMQAFILGWDWRSLMTRPLGVFNAPIFHPEPNTLTYMDHLLGETILAAPFLAFTGSVTAAYNFLFLFSFAVSAWAVYLLARYCGASRGASYLAGFLFAFSPYRFANLDVLNQLQTEFLPFGILFALKFVRRYYVRDAVALAGCLVAQVYFGWYYAYYLAIAVALVVGYALVKRSFTPPREMVWRGVAIVVGAIALILPVTLPYLREQRLLPEFHRTLGESALYSADVLDYLWNGAQSYWPGLVTVLLGAVGIRRAGSEPGSKALFAKGYFLLLTATAFVLSLGPILHVAGAKIWIPLPHVLLYYIVPGFSSMRAPARFASLVLLGLVVLASLGYDRLRKRRATTVLLFAVSIAFAWPRPLSTVELPERSMPPVYAWLAARPVSEPIMELPVPRVDADEDQSLALQQFLILHHGHPRLDGTSGFVSRRYKEFRQRIQGFPGKDALEAAHTMGAKLVIVHFGEYPAAERDRLRSEISKERGLAPLADFGNDAVFELRASN